MAYQQIYKNVIFKEEAAWGVSAAGATQLIQIVSSTLESNPNKTLVEDTRTSVKGRDRMVRLKDEIEGDIVSMGSPRGIHRFMEMAMGAAGTTAAVGSSAVLNTYPQNTSGTMLSTTLVQDRNNSGEVFYGVRAQKLNLKASDGLLEMTLSTKAKSRSDGPGVPDLVGETVKPFTFADYTVTIGRGSANTNPVTMQVAEWNIDYDNGLESSFLSGSRQATRSDPMTPIVTGSIKIFHEGTSWTSPAYGVSEFYISLQASTDSSKGLIAGVTPYLFQIDIPRAEITKNTRPYQQAEFAVETLEFTGMFDAGLSLLIRPQLTAGFDLDS